MATQVQNRRGSTSEHSTFTGAVAEVTVDTDKDTVVVHDGTTAGGRPLLREDQSNLPTSAPTTGIYNNSGALALSTSSSERIRIGPNGEIGLGGANYGTNGQVLTSAGSGAAPTWQTLSVSANSITQGNTTAEVIDTGSDGRFVVTTEGTERLRVDSSGRLGIGTTSPSQLLHVSTNSNASTTTALFENLNTGGLTYNQIQVKAGTNTATFGVGGSGTPGSAYLGSNQATDLNLFTSGASNIAFLTNSLERARIDSSGRLLVGTSSGRGVGEAGQATLQIEGTSFNAISVVNNTNNVGSGSIKLGKSRGTSNGSSTIVQNGDFLGTILFAGADGVDLETPAAFISCQVDGTPGANDMPGRLVFSSTPSGSASPVERMRIDNVGAVSTYTTGAFAFAPGTSSSAGTTNALLIGVYGRTGTTTGGTQCIRIYSNGNIENVNNSYGTLSDLKLKENIVDAGSQWADLKAVRVRNFNFKEGQTHRQIGVIAQEIEQVSPGLVYETPDRDKDGNDTGEVTKGVNYSVLYMKAVKALQEAMERIETLEAKVAALETP